MAGQQYYSKASQQLCSVCEVVPGKYVCPRCNILYCSLGCYQSDVHLQCSETFYRENVLEHMKSQERNHDDSKKVLEMLEKNCIFEQDDEEELDSDDEHDDEDLAERLAGINLDDADAIWEKLTVNEQQAFEEVLQSGNVETLIPKWKPWWKYRKEKALVELVEQSDVKVPYKKMCPLLKEVPCLTKISKCAPAPCVKWNVTNVLTAYCYMMRYFNGDPHSYFVEAVNVLVTLSGNMRLNHNFNSFEMATEDVSQEAINCPWLESSEEQLETMKDDLLQLLAGPEESNPSYYMQAALSDIYLLLYEAKKKKGPGTLTHKESKFCKRFGDKYSAGTSSIPQDKLRLLIKKLEYYLSWAKSYSNVT